MNCHPFDLLMELPSEHIRLDCAALHFARDAYPSIDLRKYFDQLDALAADVAARRPGLDAPLRYQAMREVLVEEHGFRGNAKEYCDPDNSYLNRVLERRVGVPISLSAVWIEVGRRLKWPVAGIGFPGHFLVRFDDPERLVVVDPFHDGRSLSIDDCRQLLKNREDPKLQFAPSMLDPVDGRAVLTRMLSNLRRIYLGLGDGARLVDVLRRLAAAEPENGQHLQELAALHYRQGDVRGAYAHLALYLHRKPNAEDVPIVRHNLQRLNAAMTALN